MRHASLLQDYQSATSVDWSTKREKEGRDFGVQPTVYGRPRDVELEERPHRDTVPHPSLRVE